MSVLISADLPGVGPRLPREFFARDPEVVARDLIGRVLVVPMRPAAASDGVGQLAAHSDVCHVAPDPILLRLTETEAYHGEQDPASHAYRGRTRRTAPMFGPPGHLYTYFVYGMHWCANLVTGVDGEASAVLMRAAAAFGNLTALRERRRSTGGRIPADRDLARGPARLASCIGLGGADSGVDLLGPDAPFTIHAGVVTATSRPVVDSGPRVGVAAGAQTAWRFFERGEPTVSDYRRGGRRRSH